MVESRGFLPQHFLWNPGLSRPRDDSRHWTHQQTGCLDLGSADVRAQQRKTSFSPSWEGLEQATASKENWNQHFERTRWIHPKIIQRGLKLHSLAAGSKREKKTFGPSDFETSFLPQIFPVYDFFLDFHPQKSQFFGKKVPEISPDHQRIGGPNKQFEVWN